MRDIDEIADRINKLDPASALRFVEDLHDVFRLLAQRPNIGHARVDITDRRVRFWTALRRYAVVYEIGQPIVIIHVRDWRRNPTALIDQ